MKKILFGLLVMITSITVNAKSNIEVKFDKEDVYINKNNVSITKENYNKIKNVFSEEEITNLDIKTYSLIEDSKEIISVETKYIETTYFEDSLKSIKLQREISKEEYEENIARAATPPIYDQRKYTDYKTLRMIVSKDYQNIYSFYFQNVWKKMPKYRSFDIIAFRWDGNVSIRKYEGSQYFEQPNGNKETIDYNSSSENFQTFRNGISLSQNLVDDATAYDQTLTVLATCSGKVDLFGTYQHAQADISLYDSKLFTLGPSGMGGVIVFGKQSTANIYDNTPGLSTTFTC